MLLEGRVAVVSGIGPGIGREAALALAREGADVALGARTKERLEEVAREVEGLGRRAVWLPTDITSEEQCVALAEAARDDLGRVDVLVNNAFVHPRMQPIEDTPPEAWREAFEVNVLGSLTMTRAVIPAMKEQGGGSVVFVNSLSARTGWVREGPYAAAKGALLTMARTLARELGPEGIRVNSVVPGFVWGPALEWYFNHQARKRGVDPQQVYDEVAAETALRRIPTSAEVADAIVFLASDLSRGVTGAALDVNAGHWFH